MSAVVTAIKVRLVFEDWRQVGEAKSIYNTELGFELSIGDFHSGTIFEAGLILKDSVAEEIENAWQKHRAYPVFSIMREQPCPQS